MNVDGAIHDRRFPRLSSALESAFGRRGRGARLVRRRRRRFSKFHRRRRRHRAVLLRPRLRLRRPRVFFAARRFGDCASDSGTSPCVSSILLRRAATAPRGGTNTRRDHPRSRLRVVRLRPRSDVPRRRGGLEPRRPGRRCRSGRRPRGDGSRGGSKQPREGRSDTLVLVADFALVSPPGPTPRKRPASGRMRIVVSFAAGGGDDPAAGVTSSWIVEIDENVGTIVENDFSGYNSSHANQPAAPSHATPSFAIRPPARLHATAREREAQARSSSTTRRQSGSRSRRSRFFARRWRRLSRTMTESIKVAHREGDDPAGDRRDREVREARAILETELGEMS